MLTAKVTVPFRGTPDNSHIQVDYQVGDEIIGRLAQAMVDEGWADATNVIKKKSKRGPATPGSVSQAGRVSRKSKLTLPGKSKRVRSTTRTD